MFYFAEFFRYEKYHVCYGGEEEERKANYSDMVRKSLFLAKSTEVLIFVPIIPSTHFTILQMGGW